ncbi:hypothetical protein [Aeromicrobium wangtongii]|uniref:Uncharacterized protein n=1 Tax=Aeromicrobium wangtongii TaxID=2969247 RepID=A0ABY5MA15_9ACTN|nr:hypothetical protein [Aeromicrobium wangtongii]MCD9198601.1 hypothetical protein [Aeromicrobium wangtongii]UUP12626.1 hypothetical protein NQV15_12255 [Aeromicrobium wangtongii]
MRFRKLAGTTAGALVLGALSVPMTMSAAQAADPQSVSFNCTFGQNGFVYTSTVDLTAKAVAGGTVAVTAAMQDMPNAAPSFVNLPNQDITATLGTDLGDLKGSRTGDFKGGTPIVIPALSGSVTASGSTLSLKVEDFALAVGASTNIPCTPTAPVTLTVPITPLPSKALSFTCSTFGTSYAYNTDLALTAQAKADGKIAVAASMDDMPNTAPAAIALPNQKFDATLVTDLGTLAGTRTGDFKGGVALPIPALAASMAGTGSTMTVAVKSFKLNVPDANVAIDCTLPADKSFTVNITPMSKACADAVAALPGAQSSHSTAVNAAAAEAGKIAPANAAVAAATKALKKADSSVKKANKAVKKANKAVKKAKGKAKKAKAKKNVTKKKKAVTKAKKAQKKAKAKVAAAKAQLAAAQNSSAAANNNAASAAAAVTALQNTIKNC